MRPARLLVSALLALALFAGGVVGGCIDGAQCNGGGGGCPPGYSCGFSTSKCVKDRSAKSGETCDVSTQCNYGLYCSGISGTATGTCKELLGDGADCSGALSAGCIGQFECNNNRCTKLLSLGAGAATSDDRFCKPGLYDNGGQCAAATTQSQCYQNSAASGVGIWWCAASSACQPFDCVDEYLATEQISYDTGDMRKVMNAYYALLKCQAKAGESTAPTMSMDPILIAMIAVAGGLFLCAAIFAVLFLRAKRSVAAAARAGVATTATAAAAVTAGSNLAKANPLGDDAKSDDEPDLLDSYTRTPSD